MRQQYVLEKLVCIFQVLTKLIQALEELKKKQQQKTLGVGMAEYIRGLKSHISEQSVCVVLPQRKRAISEPPCLNTTLKLPLFQASHADAG